MGLVAFSLGPLVFYWYGIIVALAILIAAVVIIWQAKQSGESAVAGIEMLIISIPVALITARLYYVLANWQHYSTSLGEIWCIWHGGMAIHGAMLGILLTLYYYTKRYNLDSWRWCDIFAIGLAVAQTFGQWGNLATQQDFGYPTQLPWGIYIDYAYRPQGYEQYDFFHPAFIYESLWSGFLFIILIVISLGQRRYHYIQSGSLFLLFLLLYSVGRIVIDGFRLDSGIAGGFRLAQVVSSSIIVLSIILLAVRNWRKQSCH